MSFTLCDVSKLSPAQQKAVMADQERATAARERVMAQLGQPAKPVDMKLGHASFAPYSAALNAKPYNLPTPAAKSPPAPLSVRARGIPKGPKVSETHIQQEIVRWWKLHACEWNLEEELLMGFPLQGARTKRNGARLKAEGMRKGTPDMLLAVPRGDCCSLWIENKSSTGKLSESQKLMLKRLTAIGAATVVCRSAAEAQAAITAYLNLTAK